MINLTYYLCYLLCNQFYCGVFFNWSEIFWNWPLKMTRSILNDSNRPCLWSQSGVAQSWNNGSGLHCAVQYNDERRKGKKLWLLLCEMRTEQVFRIVPKSYVEKCLKKQKACVPDYSVTDTGVELTILCHPLKNAPIRKSCKLIPSPPISPIKFADMSYRKKCFSLCGFLLWSSSLSATQQQTP